MYFPLTEYKKIKVYETELQGEKRNSELNFKHLFIQMSIYRYLLPNFRKQGFSVQIRTKNLFNSVMEM